ncbi:MAG: hypothetical protein Q4D16_17130 [Eubacteriales bacterium]|nr:hypothetical protein [Eubacteriales bacterium]
MKLLDKKAYEEVRTWVHRNARALDLAVWNYFFEDGSRNEILKALSFYQNEDGGFGNGVEADSWNPESSPYATLIAAGLLRQTGIIEMTGTEHPLIQGIFRYLESGVHSDEEGWAFSIPSNDHYPRAPWWTYSEEQNKIQNMGITAGLCAFILHYGDKDSALFRKAVTYTVKLLKKSETLEEFGEMGAGGVCMLLGEVMQKGIEVPVDCGSMMRRMAGIVNGRIERDPNQWAMYTPRPSEFIEAPQSPFYKGNEEIVEKELDYLIDTRNPGGVWNITWTWFDLGEKYAKEFAVSENWWMSNKAIEHVLFLKNFGRIEL